MSTSGSSSDPELRRDLDSYLHGVGADEARRALEALRHGLRQPGDLSGSRLGDFELGTLLGRGGMGEVYEAVQRSIPGRKVAVKVLSRAGPSSIRRFEREVELIGRLDHPHVVPVLAADLEHDIPHFAMKRIHGRTLAAFVRDGPVGKDYGAIARWAREVALALQHAHQHGVVHRDVNPRNVLIDDEGRAMLLDFGLARDEHSDLDLTATSDTVGTPHTMAPEQIDPRRGPIAPATDVYGLGATLYLALSGRPPFPANSRHATLSRILDAELRPPRAIDPRIPVDLQTICLKAMQRRPGERYASAGAMAEDLRAFLEFRPILAAPPAWHRRLTWFARRHSRALLVMVAVAFGLGAAMVIEHVVLPAREIERRLTHARSLAPDDPEREVALQRALELDPGDRRSRAAMAEVLLARLERQLRSWEVFAPDAERRALEERARDFLDGDELPPLLDAHGSLEVELADPEVAVRVFLCRGTVEDGGGTWSHAAVEDPTTLDLGAAPCRADAIPEGRYLLVGRAQDGRETRVPWRVRRRAVQDSAERRVRLRLPEPDLLEAGFRQVSEGWALLGEPLRRERVDEVYLQERELCLADLERLLGVDAAAIDAFHRRTASPPAELLAGPQVDPDAGGPRVEPKRALGLARPSPRQARAALVARLGPDDLEALAGAHWAVDRDRSPVQLLTAILHGLGEPDWSPNPRRLMLDLGLMQIQTFLLELNLRQALREDEGPRFLFRLPTPEEWEYAARGADGRRHPWGDALRWDFCQNHRSSTDERQHHDPVHWPEEDCSPFGIRDLAGSLQEPVMPLDAPDRVGLKRILLRGGSRFSRFEEEMRASRTDFQGVDEHRFTTGVRLAAVPLPPLPTLATDRPFSDDFEDGGSSGWEVRAFLDVPLGRPAVVEVRDGRMWIHGYRGSFSPRVIALHPVELPSGSGHLRVRLRATAEEPGDRAAAMLVFGERWPWADLELPGKVSLRRSGGVDLPGGAQLELDWPMDRWTDVEVQFEADGRFVVRAAPGDGSSAAREVEGRRRPGPVRYVGVGAGNLRGFQVEVEEIEVRIKR